MNAIKSSARVLLPLLMLATGCASAPSTAVEKANLTDDGHARMKLLERDFPDLRVTVDGSYGYAIFPSIAKGGIGIEVASGMGAVYEQGKHVGYAHLTLVNAGVLAGAVDYTELLVFQTKAAMDEFKANRTTFNANAEAVALKAGVRAYPKFVDGVAIFVKINSGLAFDASIGGQQFTFTRDDGAAPTTAPASSPSAPVNPLSPTTEPR